MTCQLVMCHPTDSMDEIPMVKILKAILIGIVGIGMVVELMSRGVSVPLATLLQTALELY